MSSRSTPPSPRESIYYWKCDRPAAFHGIALPNSTQDVEAPLLDALQKAFPGKPITLNPGTGQGNHLTWIANIGNQQGFVRVEDGPERDDYLDVESYLIGQIAELRLPAARVIASDASRSQVPFAWQVLELIRQPDLNFHFKKGTLDTSGIAQQIGTAIAVWQSIRPTGFGPFNVATLREQHTLNAYHAAYADYFFLHLERHLNFLVGNAFISAEYSRSILKEIERHAPLLNLKEGCLVHKDLAFWNILGTEKSIHAFIDWDDAISGDPMDDLSLLACFHNGSLLTQALTAYATVRPLPDNHRRRLWLHLLRNMIFKAVIRVGAGYFSRDSSFYLLNSNFPGSNLRDFTLQRLDKALHGLHHDHDLSTLP